MLCSLYQLVYYYNYYYKCISRVTKHVARQHKIYNNVPMLYIL